MANVSNATSGYWDREVDPGTEYSETYRIAWTVTQNANFTWSVNVKFYINRHGHGAVWLTPKITCSGQQKTGTFAQYGYSSDFELMLEDTFILNCNANGSMAITISGINAYVDPEWYAVWGYLTLPSFSGSYIKINNNTWKHAMAWIKVNGTWKRCRQYVKVNGTWKLADYKWLYNP